MNCSFCKFGKKEDDNTVTCRRYPRFISKSTHDLCGEFIEADITKVNTETENEYHIEWVDADTVRLVRK